MLASNALRGELEEATRLIRDELANASQSMRDGVGPAGARTLAEEARRVDGLLRTGQSAEVAELAGLWAARY